MGAPCLRTRSTSCGSVLYGWPLPVIGLRSRMWLDHLRSAWIACDRVRSQGSLFASAFYSERYGLLSFADPYLFGWSLTEVEMLD